MTYDCIIIGGGIAGLQAAIQLGRYQHRVLVIDADQGRSVLCRSFHNLLGWPDGVSGRTLRTIGRNQAEKLGIEFRKGWVVDARSESDEFLLFCDDGSSFRAKRLLFATGVMDRLPPFPNIIPCLGISAYICPDCDGFEVKGQRVIVMGSGDAGANLALALTYFTTDIFYVDHEQAGISQRVMEKLRHKNIHYVPVPIKEVLADGSQFKGVHLMNGGWIPAGRCFLGFGGNEVRSALAEKLGVQLHKNRHILTDPRTKMTNIKYVWAAGDVTVHSEQTAIAMGDGIQAAIWIHKSLISNVLENMH
ncbi:NAD(P)/FAD-dependent oxidoreductase [Bacillus smithii]|jgi:thioredoxin reductase (NADPH)|uniref:NAD(P)/FAD-dependent oxidoreductase n=1 Tax=Bacillus smithii TaxID=1479 RepID=UPI003D1D505A